jgi:methylglutaconyl-CoA hydratase
MTDPLVLSRTDRRGVATLTLNRPERNNAYNRAMIAALSDALVQARDDRAVRIVVLRGAGKHFQAGADLAFLQEAAAMPEAENLEVSRETVAAIDALQRFPKPTVALVHGGCFGGGTGMVAACDMTIASEDAVFSITEVRWGVTPAPILPQLIQRIGLGAVRRYALTAERFDAATALRMGLVSEVCAAGRLDEAAARVIDSLLLAAPEAVALTKATALEIADGAIPPSEMADRLAGEAAGRRRSREATEGLRSFFEKRKPGWYPAQEA